MKTEMAADISLNRMYSALLKIELMIVDDEIDRTKILHLLGSLKHDVKLMDDNDNHITRDIFKER